MAKNSTKAREEAQAEDTVDIYAMGLEELQALLPELEEEDREIVQERINELSKEVGVKPRAPKPVQESSFKKYLKHLKQ